MSLAERRESLAEALSAVAGITGYPYRPSTPKSGDAWPVMGRAERVVADNFAVSWSVLVMLPQDERSANDFIESKSLEIIDSLEDTGAAFVDSFGPAFADIPSGSGNTSVTRVLELTTRSE